MSGTKHTNGPWKVVEGRQWITTEGDPYGGGPMHVADVRGWGHLTGTGGANYSESVAIEIQDANARLIAAAPDLLEACQRLLQFNEELCEDVGVSKHYPSADFARAIIAKAQTL